MSAYILVTLASIGLLSLICQWLAWQVKLPAILFLLITGVVIGPVLGGFNPAITFGPLLPPMISLAVAIILFEGSLTLKFEEIHGLERVVRNLITLGILITWLSTTVAVHLIFHFPWESSALVGAISAVTGPTVIVPILRAVRPNAKISNILRWEGILIDPVGALLAVLVFGFIISLRGNEQIQHILYHFGEMVVVGSTMGVVTAYWLGEAIRRYWLPEFLHNVATLTLVLAVFTVSNLIDDGSGLLAVTIMGIWLANMKDVPISDILGFKESLSILLISGLFIILAAQINFEYLIQIIGKALILLFVIQFIVRPLSILICTWDSQLKWNERALLAWIAPRGIVAAAVSALFAIRLKNSHLDGSELLVLITFSIIIGTVIFQSLTARWVAKLLGVAEPEPKGFLIVGANSVARTLAQALKKSGFRVLVSSGNWTNISNARMEGLEGYYGNPISAHADQHLDLVGIGKMLAISSQENLNALACMRYKSEFGRDAIYAIQTKAEETEIIDKHRVAKRHISNVLFSKNITFTQLSNLIAQGATIRSTTLTDTFDFNAYKEKFGSNAILLFALDPKERLHIFTEGQTPEVAASWTVISLIKE